MTCRHCDRDIFSEDRPWGREWVHADTFDGHCLAPHRVTGERVSARLEPGATGYIASPRPEGTLL